MEWKNMQHKNMQHKNMYDHDMQQKNLQGKTKFGKNLKDKNRRHMLSLVTIWIFAYFFVVSFGLFSGYGITGIDVGLPLLFLLTAFLGMAILAIREKRFSTSLLNPKQYLKHWKKDKFTRVNCICLAGVFSLTIVIGRHIDMDENLFTALSFVDFFFFLILTMLLSLLLFGLFIFIDQYQNRNTVVTEENSQEVIKTDFSFFKRFGLFFKTHVFAASAVLYFLGYLPYFLTFFPGNSGRDTFESIQIVLGEIPMSNHQPVFFTFLIGIFIWATQWIGSLTVSLGCFAFFQMLSMVFFLAYVTKRIFKLQTATLLKVFTVLNFAFHPIVAMYSIYLTKDVLFSECMILMCFCLFDLIKTRGEILKSKSFVLKLTVFTLLSALLRNNGFYIAIVLLILMPILYKRYWKQLLLSFGTVVVFMLIWQGPVFRLLGIEKESFAEAASVPLQQIGYVIWEEQFPTNENSEENEDEKALFSAEDQAFLEKLMPFERVKEVYEPGYTDPYKFDAAFDDAFLNENVGRFLKVWWHGCLNHFPSYVKAYLMQTVGYWHYGETNTVCTQGVTENSLGVEQQDFFKNHFGFSLEGLFEKLVLAGRKAPLVCILSSMAMQMFMIWILGIQYLRRGKKEFLLFLLPYVVLWGTIMIATPAFCLLRYLYPSFLMFPYFMAELFAKDSQISEKLL